MELLALVLLVGAVIYYVDLKKKNDERDEERARQRRVRELADLDFEHHCIAAISRLRVAIGGLLDSLSDLLSVMKGWVTVLADERLKMVQYCRRIANSEHRRAAVHVSALANLPGLSPKESNLLLLHGYASTDDVCARHRSIRNLPGLSEKKCALIVAHAETVSRNADKQVPHTHDSKELVAAVAFVNRAIGTALEDVQRTTERVDDLARYVQLFLQKQLSDAGSHGQLGREGGEKLLERISLACKLLVERVNGVAAHAVSFHSDPSAGHAELIVSHDTLSNWGLELLDRAVTHFDGILAEALRYLDGRSGDPERTERDPFAILGIAAGASRAEVELAFRQRALLYHPDKVEKMAPEIHALAVEKMKELNWARAECLKRLVS